MLRSNVALTAMLGLFALGSFGCNLQIDQIFAMQQGSGVDVYMPSRTGEKLQGRLAFDGGTVMRIHVSTTLLEYLDGTVDGDVEILDLLFGVPGFTFLVFPTGLICVVLDDPPGGGTFEYDVVAEEATFDMTVNTRALLTNVILSQLIRGGAFEFPFHLVSTIPLPLVDGLGLFTGTGSLEVTQSIDEYYSVPVAWDITDPSKDTIFTIHAIGDVTLATTDTFPVTPTVQSCLDFLGT